MRTDALVRQLRDEADEVATWPVPGMGELARLRRARRRRVRTGAGASVLAVAAVVAAATVVVPHSAGPAHDPVGPAASPAPPASRAPAAQRWRATDCGPEGCRVPTGLTWRGRSLAATEGGSQPTRHGAVRSADLSISADRRAGERWALVGALGSGPRSDLAVRFGDRSWHPVPAGRLSLLRLPPSDGRSVTVMVRERTRPLPRETLRVEVYAPR